MTCQACQTTLDPDAYQITVTDPATAFADLEKGKQAVPFICAACGALNLYHLGRDKTRHIPDEDLPAFLSVMARSVSDGRLLQEIPVEKRKFVSGKLRIAFFARPRQPKSQLVKEQWDYTLSSIPTPDTYNPEVKVGKKSLPPPSVPQIVRVFGLQVERKRLADPAYQKTVQDENADRPCRRHHARDPKGPPDDPPENRGRQELISKK